MWGRCWGLCLCLPRPGPQRPAPGRLASPGLQGKVWPTAGDGTAGPVSSFIEQKLALCPPPWRDRAWPDGSPGQLWPWPWAAQEKGPRLWTCTLSPEGMPAVPSRALLGAKLHTAQALTAASYGGASAHKTTESRLGFAEGGGWENWGQDGPFTRRQGGWRGFPHTQPM